MGAPARGAWSNTPEAGSTWVGLAALNRVPPTGPLPGRSLADVPSRPAHAIRSKRVSWAAAAPPGSLGMPRLLHSLLDQTDRSNPADHRSPLRTIRRPLVGTRRP